jgi:hypothetical protein
MKMRKPFIEVGTWIWAAVAAFTTTSGDAATGADSGVGVVAEYRPAAGRFIFTRQPGTEVVPVQIGSVVMTGDRVTLPAGASVIVQLANGETASFKGPGTFAVPAAPPLGKVASTLQSMSALLDDDYRLAGTAASRGGEKCEQKDGDVNPIAVPILVPGARVIAGQRDLPLAWRGGCPPFVVRVLSGKDSLIHRESIEGWQLRLDDVPMSVGQYSIAITDAAGRRFTADLSAVARGPDLPPDLLMDTSSLGVIAQAAWLAGQDGGRWRLESFERLRPLIRAGDPLAGAVGDGVLWGPASAPAR